MIFFFVLIFAFISLVKRKVEIYNKKNFNIYEKKWLKN